MRTELFLWMVLMMTPPSVLGISAWQCFCWTAMLLQEALWWEGDLSWPVSSTSPLSPDPLPFPSVLPAQACGHNFCPKVSQAGIREFIFVFVFCTHSRGMQSHYKLCHHAPLYPGSTFHGLEKGKVLSPPLGREEVSSVCSIHLSGFYRISLASKASISGYLGGWWYSPFVDAFWVLHWPDTYWFVLGLCKLSELKNVPQRYQVLSPTTWEYYLTCQQTWLN